MNEEYWRTLHDIASGRPLYIRVDTIQALQKLGLAAFSWRHRGLVLTRAGKEAIAAEVLSATIDTMAAQIEPIVAPYV